MQGGAVDPARVAKKLHVPTYEEVTEKIKSRYPRRARGVFQKQMASLQLTRDIIISKTDFIRELVRLLDSLHPFYWRLIEIEFERTRIHESIKCISKSRKLVDKFFNKYKFLLMASESREEAQKVAREGRGRMLSTLKKCRDELEYLRRLVIFLKDLPAIDPRLPTIIIAGAPSTGKSTLVRSVSRARPEISPYPFTTKEIHVGHFYVEDTKVQIIDTPGILDRPPSAMNPIERRAAAALAELRGAILFLIDPTKESYMTVEEQFSLLRLVTQIASNKKIFVGINKIDVAEENVVNSIEEKLKFYKDKGVIEEYFLLSAINSQLAASVVESIAREIISLDRRP